MLIIAIKFRCSFPLLAVASTSNKQQGKLDKFMGCVYIGKLDCEWVLWFTIILEHSREPMYPFIGLSLPEPE
jgi:hypothetical protein